MAEKVLIGTSGWSYDEWLGVFYPKSLTKRDFLMYYSAIFYTNEINTTFYNIPSRGTVESWAKRTPSDFTFSAKIPKTITHDTKLELKDCADEFNYFLEAMEPLIESGKLLAFLIQLPPSFTKEQHFGRLEEFIENWPRDREQEKYHLVVEFRHKSWLDDEVFSYLKRNKLTYCTVIEPLLPPRMDVTNSEFAYIRFHGYGKKIWFDYFFKEEEIKKWADEIRGVVQKSDKVGIYFNNHYSGYATKNSLMMMAELNVQPRTYSKGQTSLDKFF